MPEKILNIRLNDRAIATWEVASIVSSAIIAEWLLVAVSGLPKFVVAIPVVLAFALMIASQIERRETLKELGVRVDNFNRTGALLLPASLLLALILLAYGYLAGSISFLRWGGGHALPFKLLFGFLWALAQQYALQCFINRRLSLVLGTGWFSALLVALIFAVLHLPNLWLAGATFLAGLMWAAIFQRLPNLFATALSQVLLTWVLVSTMPPALLAHLRFGAKYFF